MVRWKIPPLWDMQSFGELKRCRERDRELLSTSITSPGDQSSSRFQIFAIDRHCGSEYRVSEDIQNNIPRPLHHHSSSDRQHLPFSTQHGVARTESNSHRAREGLDPSSAKSQERRRWTGGRATESAWCEREPGTAQTGNTEDTKGGHEKQLVSMVHVD